MSKLTYLASPYSHPDPVVREQRFRDVCIIAAKLMREGELIFSPIAHTHPIAEAGDLPKEWDFWEKYDRAILSNCERLIVLQLDGWDLSVGVRAEISIANELGILVEYMEHKDFTK